MKELKGVAASGGIGIGPALRFTRSRQERPEVIAPEAVAEETARLEAAIGRAKEALAETVKRLSPAVAPQERQLFDAQALMLDDRELVDRAKRGIREHRWTAEHAITEAGAASAAQIEALSDEYLRARAADVRDVVTQVRSALEGDAAHPLAHLQRPSVIVADELLPSDTAAVDRSKVLAFVTEVGSATAHAAILARSLSIPAVVGVAGATAAVGDGDTLIVDGTHGVVIADPDAATIEEWRRRHVTEEERKAHLEALRALPAETTDGHWLELAMNIGTLQDIRDGLRYGAEGIGLFRTEFLFLNREGPPTEDEQYEVYAHAGEAMATHTVIIRTLDIGGDKPLPWLSVPPENNPFLGLRGLRLSLRHEDVFLTQLRALLRAAARGKIWIMLPMVADVGEVREARRQLAKAEAQLAARGTASGRAPLGIMIEIPSAAVLGDTLFTEIDFFSVGTNDLLQYTLAADRTNARVADMADALHPGVLRLISMVTRSPRRGEKWVGVCGELAGDPAAAPLLMGLGVNELSMTASLLLDVKRAVRAVSFKDAQALATRALECGTAAEVRALVAPAANTHPLRAVGREARH